MPGDAVTFPQLLRRNRDEHGAKPALILEDAWITHAALEAESRALSGRLVAAGVGDPRVLEDQRRLRTVLVPVAPEQLRERRGGPVRIGRPWSDGIVRLRRNKTPCLIGRLA